MLLFFFLSFFFFFIVLFFFFFFFFSSRRRHTRCLSDWSSECALPISEELPRVTGKFYRGKSVVDKVKGSGLGLYLSKYFVELHEGRLEISSEVNRGTEVSFWLPIPK